MHAELERALAALEPRLGAPESEPQPLEGGITNRNFRIRLGDRDVVVRLPGKDTELLGIDRAAERDAIEAAARAGVGPEVVAFLAEPPCLVTAFIAGRPVEAAELRVPPLYAELADGARAIQRALAGPEHAPVACHNDLLTAISALDFDFAAYADEHLERVAAGIADPRFPAWLEDAGDDRT